MTGNVRPIPEGHNTVTPHLIVSNCAKALEFYTKAFGARELFRIPGPDGNVLHAEFQIGDSIIYMCEECSEAENKSPQALNGSPVTIHLYVEDVDTAFKKATDAGAEVVTPLANVFWGDRYGRVTDPFGHRWSLATHVEDVPQKELEQRAATAMSGSCAVAAY